MKKITIDGNEAAAYASYMLTEMASIYPITPSSPMAEHIDKWSSEGMINLFDDKVKVVEMQSEAGAAGMLHGALSAGVLASTYTASQGLLLMLPNMYKIAGEMLPAVMHVAARSLSTHALSIFGDHQDVMAARTTGFCMLASSSVQDTNFLSAIAHLSAIDTSLPFLHFFDGFRTSHELQKIDILELKDIKTLLNYDQIKSFRQRALNPKKTFTKGTAENDDIYFQMAETKNLYYDKVPDIVNNYMKEINKITKSNYKPFNYYGSPKAEHIILAMGSVCETIKETIDYLNNKNYNYGLIEVHLYRPFSKKYLLKELPSSIKTIAVLNRTKENGGKEPLYLDVLDALKDTNIKVVSGRYGLSSKNTNPAQIKAVFEMLNKPKDNFTIGINDDVTHLSLRTQDFKISQSDELLIYGYGSDGMVSASKSIITLIGNNTNKYVQGYFEYDSKKSGGVTISHLRFNQNKIRSTYYVENPSVVVVTKENYLDKFNCLEHIKENGIFILNTFKNKQEIINKLPASVSNIILKKHIKFYIINAYDLARKVGLDNKISTIMESVIMKVTNLIDYSLAQKEMKKFAKEKFFKKGEEVLNSNYKAIDEAINYLQEINITEIQKDNVKKLNNNNLYQEISKRNGNKLPVSAFMEYADGHFISGTTKSKEVEPISDLIPKWNKDNCIMCNQCSFVCPHSVIRPYLLSKEEYLKAPKQIQQNCLIPFEPSLKDYYFTIAVSMRNCTGCGLCVKTCPGKKGMKALELLKTEDDQEIYDYLEQNIIDKEILNKNTIKGCQFIKPKFHFCGACAGCGETSYIKVLTQLLGKNLVIANATGCSSIYGGSMPDTPYDLPWANSLFEDNAEFGYGILIGNEVVKNRIKQIMLNNMNNSNSKLFKQWLKDPNDYENTNYVYKHLNKQELPTKLNDLLEYIPAKTIWTIGGDGWAYDIGFGGIDHVLSSNDDVNILVLDTQVYSNTGGQASKASPKGAIASFAASGKQTSKKDLAKIALAYPNVYVAQVSLGYNMMQLIKAFNEAAKHKGPSIIIAYASCISHGIKGGMNNSVDMESLATKSGYFPIFRYNPEDKQFTLDSEADFNLYDEFIQSQSRYSMLQKINPQEAKELLKINKNNAFERYQYYQQLSHKNN